jgi:hypothetical protein
MTETLVALDPTPTPEPRPLRVVGGLSSAAVRRAVAEATGRVAPLWPLRHFVAVNPFLGLSDRDFKDAARLLARVAGARMTAPRAFYAEALRRGRMTRQDLADALSEADRAFGVPTDPADLEALAFGAEADHPHRSPSASAAEVVPTVADVASAVTGQDWHRLVVEQVSSWAASYFDGGQAPWSSPFRGLSPYAAWRAEARIDRTPDVAGLRGFRAAVGELPEDPEAAIEAALRRLLIPEAGLVPYLHRVLSTVGGWASYARYLGWEQELRGSSDATLRELLAIRLAYEAILLQSFPSDPVAERWGERLGELRSSNPRARMNAALAVDLILQDAFDRATQRELVHKLRAHASDAPGVEAPRSAARPSASAGTAPAASSTPKAQAVFCIDVRSEVFRRALEAADPSIATVGFAGFFGVPLEHVELGRTEGGSHCPALLSPSFVIPDAVHGEGDVEPDEDATERARARRDVGIRVAKAWRSFKFAAVSCFGFVGPVGLAYAKKLVTDSFGRTRPVELPSRFGLDDDAGGRIAPALSPGRLDGRAVGITLEQKRELAASMLKAMSLTEGLARTVLLVGHGSTTVNNPHASGLDCGACGGHTGEANARVAAAILNDPEVRAALVADGLAIPDETLFVAAQHDTTTDDVTLFDADSLPANRAADLADLRDRLADAGTAARRERFEKLNRGCSETSAVKAEADVRGRSRDWSQVRPEWGLAGCSSFIVAPRHRTRGLDLEGRAFLHSYDWRQDDGFEVLELIMTAPMVVASWISLQYYGSSVDNDHFGSGNKVLHNVVGTLGVLEGNGGDLRVGLPWQSVHDGERLVHEPVRLAVFIEAPVEAIDAVLVKHEAVRQLVDNHWLTLFALDEQGRPHRRCVGNGTWAGA